MEIYKIYPMKFKEFRNISAYLAAAFVVGGVWAFHIAEAGHELKDNDCQVCAVVCSPELNADCGTRLVAKPEDFTLLAVIPVLLPAAQAGVFSFNSRAPPLSV